jgi:hypothetical protein
MGRYIGLDAHASSCTVAVIGPSGRRLGSHVVETNAPHVQEIVVTAVPQNRGPKSDKRDAFALAEMLRIGSIPRRVYKQRGCFTRLMYLAKAYQALVSDDVRVQNRIKSLLRSRGVQVAGSTVYTTSGRHAHLDQLPAAACAMTNVLYRQHDQLTELRKQAQKDMITEAREHAAYRCVKSCPGLSSVRSARILPVVATPYRFANKRQCGSRMKAISRMGWPQRGHKSGRHS